MIFQGDIYWVDLGDPEDSEPAKRRPMVVIQSDGVNQSGIRTTVMCALTGNLNRARVPGNVLLDVNDCNEAKLPYPECVVNVSQIYTVSMSALTDIEFIGSLSATRVREIIEGVKQLFEDA